MQTTEKKYNVLIASHSEDLDWLRFLPKERNYKVIVSNSNRIKEVPYADEVLPRENYGREAGHYFNYMVEYYDNLPETTIFIQGDPWPHAAAGNYTISLMEILLGDPEFVWPISYLGRQYSPSNLLAAKESTQYRALQAGLGDLSFGQGIPISIGANFYAKKNIILSRPKEVYVRFLEFAKDKKNYPDDPYYTLAHDLEGVWGGVFAHSSGKRSI
jgi:hypothetical protein